MVDEVNHYGCEYGRQLEKRVSNMEQALRDASVASSVNSAMLDELKATIVNLAEVVGDFSKVVQKIEITLVTMGEQIRNNSEETQVVTQKIEKLQTDFTSAEDKNKLDWRTVIKDVLQSKVTWLVSGGVIILLCNATVYVFENFDKIKSIISVLIK